MGRGGGEEAVDAVGIFPEEADIVVADDQELEIQFPGNSVYDGHEAGDQVRTEPAVLLIQDQEPPMFPFRQLREGNEPQAHRDDIAD